ncbi:hypothetical protein [Rubidibacter lacunae]|uniref:hypothetical protein n=1 Tax=Rubidibacter lacunae TaxID=582514 RepID=UPI0012EB900A|nr:hypothetical protein [Rubidibacter lacunae]
MTENDPVYQLVCELLHKESLFYCPQVSRDLFERTLAPAIASGKTTVLSVEGIGVGNTIGDRGLAAQRLRDLFGPAKVLVAIRNQLDIVVSMYFKNGCRARTNYTNGYRIPPVSGIAGRFVDFESWLQFLWDTRDLGGLLSRYQYGPAIAAFEAQFGAENVCVWLFEDFKYRRTATVQMLCDFIGVDVEETQALLADAWENKGPEAITRCRLIRIDGSPLARIVFRLQTALDRLNPFSAALASEADPQVSPIWQKRLAAYYDADNRALARSRELNLAEYNYPQLPA